MLRNHEFVHFRVIQKLIIQKLIIWHPKTNHLTDGHILLLSWAWQTTWNEKQHNWKKSEREGKGEGEVVSGWGKQADGRRQNKPNWATQCVICIILKGVVNWLMDGLTDWRTDELTGWTFNRDAMTHLKWTNSYSCVSLDYMNDHILTVSSHRLIYWAEVIFSFAVLWTFFR